MLESEGVSRSSRNEPGSKRLQSPTLGKALEHCHLEGGILEKYLKVPNYLSRQGNQALMYLILAYYEPLYLFKQHNIPPQSARRHKSQMYHELPCEGGNALQELKTSILQKYLFSLEKHRLDQFIGTTGSIYRDSQVHSFYPSTILSSRPSRSQLPRSNLYQHPSVLSGRVIGTQNNIGKRTPESIS